MSGHCNDGTLRPQRFLHLKQRRPSTSFFARTKLETRNRSPLLRTSVFLCFVGPTWLVLFSFFCFCFHLFLASVLGKGSGFSNSRSLPWFPLPIVLGREVSGVCRASVGVLLSETRVFSFFCFLMFCFARTAKPRTHRWVQHKQWYTFKGCICSFLK